MTEHICERLVAALEAQQATVAEQGQQIARQAEQIGLLVQSIAMLLGEELGASVPDDDEPKRLDTDGNPY